MMEIRERNQVQEIEKQDILQLSVDEKWFAPIKEGKQWEVYRDLTPYWFSRLYQLRFGGKRYDISEDQALEILGKFNGNLLGQLVDLRVFVPKPYKRVIISWGFPEANDFARQHLADIADIKVGYPEENWIDPIEKNDLKIVVILG